MVCGGRFCTNGYLITSGCDSCMLQEFQVCLCLGTDAACLPVPDSIPKSCACLPCCFVYPKVACCPAAGELFPEMENLHEKKKDAKMCSGTCLGPLYAGNTYFITPYTLCADELSTCLCFAQDCAFPCTDSIPMTCNILPCCFVYPKVACCPKLGDGGQRWPGRRQDGTSGAARSTRPLRGVLLPAPLLPGDDEGQPVRHPPGAS